MPVSSSWLLVLQRLAVLRILGQRLQGARLPVDPGRVLLLGRRHRVDRLHHLLPARLAAVGAQGRAHFPGEQVVGQLELLALAVDAARRAGTGRPPRAAASSRSAGRRWPRPRPRGRRGSAFSQRSTSMPATDSLSLAARRISARVASSASTRAAVDAFFPGTGRALEDLADARRHRRAEQDRGLARRPRLVRLGREADLLPDLGAASSAWCRPASAPSRAQPSSASFCAIQAAMPAALMSRPAICSVTSE